MKKLYKGTFNEFMNAKITVERNRQMIVFLSGMFCGVVLGIIFALLALV